MINFPTLLKHFISLCEKIFNYCNPPPPPPPPPPPRGGGHFLFIQNLIFFLTIYTYKLLQAFPPKASVENSSAQWAIFF